MYSSFQDLFNGSKVSVKYRNLHINMKSVGENLEHFLKIFYNSYKSNSILMILSLAYARHELSSVML